MLLNVVPRGPDAADASPRARPPIVLLHGLFGRARNLNYHQRRLATDRRVLAVDLRNHGDSPHGPMDYASMALDLAETLAAHDALPATVVGHSMGGKAAMMLSLLKPDAVASLVVADIPPAVTRHGTDTLGQRMLQTQFPAHLNRAGADALLRDAIPEDDVRSLMLQNLRLGDDPGWTIGLDEIVASMGEIEGWPFIPEGHAYDGPTLFLAGENSPYIRSEDHPAMRQLFPRHRLEVIEKAGHWLHVENPGRFLELLQQFTA